MTLSDSPAWHALVAHRHDIKAVGRLIEQDIGAVQIAVHLRKVVRAWDARHR